MIEWRELASISNWSRDLSLLDTLPEDWLLDSTDWVHVFANIVSPKLSKRFEELLTKIVSKKELNAAIKAGPAKTLSRSLAKSHEYRSEYRAKSGSKRWFHFREKFREVFGRSPKASQDFVWNLMDF